MPRPEISDDDIEILIEALRVNIKTIRKRPAPNYGSVDIRGHEITRRELLIERLERARR